MKSKKIVRPPSLNLWSLALPSAGTL